MDHLKLIHEKLSIEDITKLVESPKCGAISTFIGTTRDNFEGKIVVQLEYDAYETMAIKAMKTICQQIRDKWNCIEHIAIYHRLGRVPVQEASVIIAISSPHRHEAMQATQWCIDELKKGVPIWKKEVYAGNETNWKENKEFSNFVDTTTLNIKQTVEVSTVPSNLIQIKASNDEIEERIRRFMLKKRDEINRANIRDFCRRKKDENFSDSCARIDSVLIKPKNSKGHLQVNKVYNTYSRDQDGLDYLKKYIPVNGIEERVANLECQLSLNRPTPIDIYSRLKELEDRLMYMESISPEYIQFWDKTSVTQKVIKRKKVFSIHEIDKLINNLENAKT